MKRLRGLLIIILVVALGGIAGLFVNKSLKSDYEQLTASVYCHCGCERDTILTCVCGTAQQIKNDFRDRLDAGETVEQIRTEYITTHGTQFSAVMPVEGINIFAYLMPIVIIVALGVIVLYVMKSKVEATKPVGATGPVAPTATQPVAVKKEETVSKDVYSQIESEIERYKRRR